MYYNFESPFIAWYPVKEHKKIKENLLPKLYTNPICKKETGNSLTSFNSSLDENMKFFSEDEIFQFLWKPFQQLMDEKNFNPKITNSHIKHMWWNQYSPGDYAIAHHHSDADFCGMYLLDCPESNTTFFHPHVSNCHYPFDGGSYPTDHILEGYTMFWPSYLMHSAIPAKMERMVVVFNIQSDWY